MPLGCTPFGCTVDFSLALSFSIGAASLIVRRSEREKNFLEHLAHARAFAHGSQLALLDHRLTAQTADGRS